jgi:hypothetical protein
MHVYVRVRVHVCVFVLFFVFCSAFSSSPSALLLFSVLVFLSLSLFYFYFFNSFPPSLVLLLKKMNIFLKIHKVDAENSLLGLRPSALVMEAIVPFEPSEESGATGGGTSSSCEADADDADELQLQSPPRAVGQAPSLSAGSHRLSRKRSNSMKLQAGELVPRRPLGIRSTRMQSENSLDDLVSSMPAGQRAVDSSALSTSEKHELAKLAALDGLASVCVDIGEIPEGAIAARRLRQVAHLLELTRGTARCVFTVCA